MRREFVAAVALLWSLPAAATDHFIPGKIAIVKDAKLAKIIAKPATTFPIPSLGSGGDPVLGGGSVEMLDTDGSGTLIDSLGAGSWSALGNPPGTSGYKYKNASAPLGGAVKIIILKPNVIKILAKDDGLIQPGAMGQDLGVILSTGTTPDRYCASFGGTNIKNDPTLFKEKDALAPGMCPSAPTCCDGNGFLNFTNVTAPGDCGDVIDANGMLVTNIACGGYYTGGGGNSFQLPVAAPDAGSMTMAVASCAGAVATVGATSSATTGSNENCTSAGCLFGAPRAMPNPGTTPLSMCVVAKVSTAPTGTVDCSTGATSINLGVAWDLHLTGDFATDPGSTIPGIQPCPLCSGGTCVGGQNAGSSCTPDTTVINNGYPTSNDCPPAASSFVLSLPIGYGLSTGTVSWTGTPATNDTGSTASTQLRVFSGYCRDVALPGGTGGFDAGVAPGFQSKKCWENGMAVGSACSGADNNAESCEQRNHGAFGPNGHFNQTITAIGNSMSIIGGPAPATLVSIFSIPPGFDAVIDAILDLPGPGAVALPGTARSCSNAMSCP